MNAEMTRNLAPDKIVVLRAGQRLRVCVDYECSIRALLWVTVRPDGSLLTNFSGQLTDVRWLVPESLPDGRARFVWGRSVASQNVAVRPKISFHASGMILSDSGRSVGSNLRLLTHRTFVCWYLPPHPMHWRTVDRVRMGDLVIRELLGDDCPLSVELYYQPAGTLPVLESKLDQGSFVLPVGYTNVEVHERVLLHFVFRRQSRAGVWPPRWGMGWPRIGPRTSPLKSEGWFEPGPG